MLIFFAVLAAVFFSIALFLGKEMMKKFSMFVDFTNRTDQLSVYIYGGARKHDISPGMYKMVLRSDQPFSALIGLHLTLPLFGSGFDYYGVVHSDQNGFAAFTTYLGTGGVQFMFLTSHDLGQHPVSIFIDYRKESAIPATAEYPPHWWQRIGFFG